MNRVKLSKRTQKALQEGKFICEWGGVDSHRATRALKVPPNEDEAEYGFYCDEHGPDD